MRKILKSFMALTVLFLFSSVGGRAAPAGPPAKPYRLGVVLVVDQFRADYLLRFRDRFLRGDGQTKGYRFLMEQGAYFPLADHGLLHNMTGPGHAAILSGSYPYRNLISMNTWFDRERARPQYCVADEAARLIGSTPDLKDANPGMSPRNFNASTVGDELKNVDRASRVISVSLKDRAAILLGGKRADVAIWFSEKNCQWVTSDFYSRKLPEFAKRRNEAIAPEKGRIIDFGTLRQVETCSKDSLRTPWGIEQTFELALAAVDEYRLGSGKDTDLLLISLSTHDYLGHSFGPNHPNLEELTLAEDRLISKFLNALSAKVPGGLTDLFVVMTGDHGMAPSGLPPERVPSGNIPDEELRALSEKTLREHFGSPKGGRWVDGVAEFQLYLNGESLRAADLSPARVLAPLRERLLRERYVDQVWARDEILYERKVPAGEYGLAADRTLSRRSGDIIVVLRPYFWSDTYPYTHMTQYSYDRYVPLIFYGRTFRRGTYRQIVNIVDVAPTLAGVLHVIPPSQSEGRVLTEILR